MLCVSLKKKRPCVQRLYLNESGKWACKGWNANGTKLKLYLNTTSQTSSTFSSHSVYIPNYAGSNNKSTSSDNASENNATTAYIYLMAGLWSNSAAITSIAITEEGAATGSRHTLYNFTRLQCINRKIYF